MSRQLSQQSPMSDSNSDSNSDETYENGSLRLGFRAKTSLTNLYTKWKAIENPWVKGGIVLGGAVVGVFILWLLWKLLAWCCGCLCCCGGTLLHFFLKKTLT